MPSGQRARSQSCEASLLRDTEGQRGLRYFTDREVLFFFTPRTWEQTNRRDLCNAHEVDCSALLTSATSVPELCFGPPVCRMRQRCWREAGVATPGGGGGVGGGDAERRPLPIFSILFCDPPTLAHHIWDIIWPFFHGKEFILFFIFISGY